MFTEDLMTKFKLILLLVVFFVAFWFSGGNSMLGKLVPQFTPIETKTSDTKDSAESILILKSNMQNTVTEIGNVGSRIYRLITLPSAVKAKLDKTNYVPLSQVPLTMQQSIIAVEDNRFYRHIGFDVEGILRATLVNVQSGSIQEGGSTITQQLVKNLFLNHEQTFGRKAEEILLAVDMEIRFSKEEILEMYLNTIYFGSGSYGLKNASQVYFAKSPDKLTLPEAAILAGIPNAPSLYSPYVDYYAAKQRQAIVLSTMVKAGFIGPQQAYDARIAPLRFVGKIKQ